MMSALFRLDKYLTGKTETRRLDEDKRDFKRLFDGRDFLVYLSDGGYSRLTLKLEMGNPVLMDLSLSREPVKKRWKALFPPS
jgi:hypothetical protein